MCRKATVLKAERVERGCRDQIRVGCKNKEEKICQILNSNILIFFGLRTISHLPQTMQIGPGMSEIMINYGRKSALLGYRSLARYRSLGFDKHIITISVVTITEKHCTDLPI